MATLNTAIRGAQISLSAEVIAVATDELAFIDADGIMKRESVADLATAMAGSGLTATAGVLSADAIADNILEADIQVENVSSQIDDTGYAGDFTISNTPLANSVQVYLRGLYQEEGTGKDYTRSGTTISFVIAPESGDNVIVHYITDNA